VLTSLFYFGKSAKACGIGEDLKEVQSCTQSWYLVLIPPCAVSTKDAFAWWDEENLTKAGKRKTIMPFLKNDLQEVVCAHVPQIKEYLQWLGQGGQMTGSGSALFKAFTQKEEALASARLFPEGICWVVVQTLEQHPLYDFWGVAKR